MKARRISLLPARCARKQGRRRPARAFYSPARIGLRAFGDPSANAGCAVCEFGLCYLGRVGNAPLHGPTIRDGRNKGPFLFGNAAYIAQSAREKHCTYRWRERLARGLTAFFWPCPARLWRLPAWGEQPPKAN